ncbi:hypothetical protein G3O00_28320 [Burkholderia sp. Ac-20384]|uniref:hypothetical protein n=1 Tax=Burkholderia sp. Ac-20384 TaxID=2703902 RepID=UPI00198116D5|nr:hypothetical protein [Burkholderia sp. Ac-20384]MBN3827504.1 hypothetical protein [Burkholderia sp. Ac-20384]
MDDIYECNEMRSGIEIVDVLRRPRSRCLLVKILGSEFDRSEADIYLMAYDCGLAEALFGIKSAIYIGLDKGLRDAIFLSSGGHSAILEKKFYELGRWSGYIVNEIMSNAAQN